MCLVCDLSIKIKAESQESQQVRARVRECVRLEKFGQDGQKEEKGRDTSGE